MEKPKRTSITFNDKDAILDMGTNNETFVDAPKTAERLEDISKKANERRKREEEDDFADDEFDDGPINIMGDNISLDIMDIQDLSESPKIIEDDLLNDIEILA